MNRRRASRPRTSMLSTVLDICLHYRPLVYTPTGFSRRCKYAALDHNFQTPHPPVSHSLPRCIIRIRRNRLKRCLQGQSPRPPECALDLGFQCSQPPPRRPRTGLTRPRAHLRAPRMTMTRFLWRNRLLFEPVRRQLRLRARKLFRKIGGSLPGRL